MTAIDTGVRTAGEGLVSDHMAALGMSVRVLADEMGVSLGYASSVCNDGMPITEDFAEVLVPVFGESPSYCVGVGS